MTSLNHPQDVEAVIRILVVDDEAELTQILVEWLSKKGHEAVGLTAGSSVRDWVTQNDVDVVLLDLLMPDANGLSLISRIRQLKPETKIIIVSAIDDPKIAASAIREGASSYLAKPIDFEILQRVLLPVAERSD